MRDSTSCHGFLPLSFIVRYCNGIHHRVFNESKAILLRELVRYDSADLLMVLFVRALDLEGERVAHRKFQFHSLFNHVLVISSYAVNSRLYILVLILSAYLVHEYLSWLLIDLRPLPHHVLYIASVDPDIELTLTRPLLKPLLHLQTLIDMPVPWDPHPQHGVCDSFELLLVIESFRVCKHGYCDIFPLSLVNVLWLVLLQLLLKFLMTQQILAF